ncbi:beta-ketoacyl-ACP synthase III [Maricaulis sp.]|uniref:beta-ketoacyl-ACP synthase III n=1 Tax=Maricaulis sp. TaxID=1486257 RepID=UPI0025F63F17|nr:beta-ketoacyl-ACP synthase III [Maricaulis sp.]MDF1769668.1 beta-ketoacyl-ACP synthase III [Maricaulis sp.]
MQNSLIRSTGYWVPPNVITNDELVASYNAYATRFNSRHADAIAAGEAEAVPLSSSEFIRNASGIERRHVYEKTGILDIDSMVPRIPPRPVEAVSVQAEFALKSVQIALDKAGYDGSDIDGVIVASSAQQRNFPAVSCEIQEAIGASGFAFDMTMACAAALYGLNLANGLIRSGQAKRILICSPELMTCINVHSRREVHFIFGDASAAMIVEADDGRPGGWDVLGTHTENKWSSALRSDYGFINIAEQSVDPAFAPHLDQDGHKVFKDVVGFAPKVARRMMQQIDLTPNDVRRTWLHQANIRMVDMIAKRILERDRTNENAPSILHEYGNTSSSSVVMNFDMHSDDMAVGETGVMCAFGAGYGVGAAAVRKRA